MNGRFFNGIFFLVAAIMALNSAPAAPTELITAYGDEFNLAGQAYRFVGVNIRGICHYGKGDILVWTSEGHIDENLDGVVNMGGKVVRLFAPCKFATHQENVNRLKNVLDKMQTRNLKAIVCFTDLYNTGFCPKGDESYYMSQPGGWTLLDDTWFKTGYLINYKPYVQLAVTQLKDHNAIFAWELGNELTDIKDPSAILAFTADMASTIKGIDPWHMVTTGYIGVDHTQVGEIQGYNMYADSNIDFITEHSYNGSEQSQNHAVHSRLRKPLVIEEFGWEASHGNRQTNTQAMMVRYMDERMARGFMNWGYQAQSYDIGDGDNIFGIDQYAHPDYTQLVGVYQTRAGQIASNPVTLPARLEPMGTNVALLSTGWQADSIYSGDYGGDKATDGVISASSKWTSLGTAPPHWLSIDLGQYRDLDGLTLRMGGAANENIGYNFKTYQIQTGSSLTGPWTTDFAGNNPAQFSFLHFLYDTPKSARYARLYITDSGVDNYCRLPEFEVYEVSTSVEAWWLY